MALTSARTNLALAASRMRRSSGDGLEAGAGRSMTKGDLDEFLDEGHRETAPDLFGILVSLLLRHRSLCASTPIHL